mgnify:CR=1 FL=1|jgi:RNA binding exosome subunit
MAVHNLMWVATSSAVGMKEAIQSSLDWLTGDYAKITCEKVRSYHGPKMMMMKAYVGNKKDATNAVCHLGADLLNSLAESNQLPDRIDESNTLHIRLDLAALVRGEIHLADESSLEVVKGRIKLEVYPGQDTLERAADMLEKAVSKAIQNDFPRSLAS